MNYRIADYYEGEQIIINLLENPTTLKMIRSHPRFLPKKLNDRTIAIFDTFVGDVIVELDITGDLTLPEFCAEDIVEQPSFAEVSARIRGE